MEIIDEQSISLKPGTELLKLYDDFSFMFLLNKITEKQSVAFLVNIDQTNITPEQLNTFTTIDAAQLPPPPVTSEQMKDILAGVNVGSFEGAWQYITYKTYINSGQIYYSLADADLFKIYITF